MKRKLHDKLYSLGLDPSKLVSFDEHLESLPKSEQTEIENLAAQYRLLDGIKVVRQELGMTQKELAEKSGIPRPTISKIENGKRNVTIQTIIALATAMGKRVELNFV